VPLSILLCPYVFGLLLLLRYQVQFENASFFVAKSIMSTFCHRHRHQCIYLLSTESLVDVNLNTFLQMNKNNFNI